MSRRVAVDLHIHTALSPCAAEEMKPPAIMLSAERRGLAVVGIVDHSTARNAPAVLEAAEAFDVRVLVGLEAESAEGVHLLALFDSAETALAMDAAIAQHLPPLANRPDFFGAQHRLDAWGDIVGEDPRLLAAATDLGVERLADLTAQHGGLAIPAHIDRRANGLLPTLGFIPPGLRADLWELSPQVTSTAARRTWPELQTRALLHGSDAHCLHDVGCAPTRIPAALARAELGLPEWGLALARELLAWGDGDDDEGAFAPHS
jgi:PHP family Zn ribbon phosphoesterase